MIKKYLSSILLLVLPSLIAAQAEPKYGEADFNAAAKAFMADPVKNSKPNCGIMFAFASESPDVSVLISEKTGIVWINEKSAGKEDLRALLLCGYITGSVESQLKSRKKENDAIAGIKASLKVYAFIRKINPTFKIASVEKLITAEKNGKLQELLDAIEEK